MEINHAVNESIQCVILALCYTCTSVMLVATLANDDIARNY